MKLAAFALVAAAMLIARPTVATESFGGWAGVIVSGDDRAAHVDAPTEAFDNARRDIASELERRGFAAADIEEFSVEPNRHSVARLATPAAIGADLRRLAARAPDGCLFYLTSHGSPDGAELGARLVSPRALGRLIGHACGRRPTIVVISACYSGVFVPALAGANRLIITAARRDRSSFGCGEADKYPYFDGCVLEVLPAAADFIALADKARACVARREREEGMAPPSEPQIFVGPRFRSPRFAGVG
ncbi:MAG: C13 family peptidase [Caulobacteraceae bacterium]